MTSKEVMEWIEFILADTSTDIYSAGERTVRTERRKRNEVQLQQAKAEKDILLTAWFMRDEFICGDFIKRLQLTLEYILTDTHGQWKLPDEVAREMARCLLPNIIAYFDTEEGKIEFAKWQKKKIAEGLEVKKETEASQKDGE